jgi:hypothetical protein
MDFERGYAVSQRIRPQLGAMPLEGDDQASYRFNNESTISAPGLEKARPREIGIAVPTNCIENLADHRWFGVNSAAAMQCLNFERHLCRSISSCDYLGYGAFAHWLSSSNVE